jgi:hypothetical protein
VNRQDMISKTLLWEQLAKRAKAKADAIRDQLAADARAELEAQGTAPTWRLPEVGTVTLPVSQETVYLADEAALLKWLKSKPGDDDEAIETIERVRPSYLGLLIDAVEVFNDETVIYPPTGEVVPGLRYRPGGQPLALSFRPTRDAKAFAGEYADKLLVELEQHLGS